MEMLIDLFKLIMVCGTLLLLAMLVLLALPHCKLRSVGMQIGKWILCLVMGLLVLSPIDILPDIVPVGGWLDDIVYFACAVLSARSAMREPEKRALMDAAAARLRATREGGAA